MFQSLRLVYADDLQYETKMRGLGLLGDGWTRSMFCLQWCDVIVEECSGEWKVDHGAVA